MIGPNLPKNINIQITILLPSDNSGVIPVVKPTVPKAENVSNIVSSAVTFGLFGLTFSNEVKNISMLVKSDYLVSNLTSIENTGNIIIC